jgi:hypothetical protein
MKNNLAGKFLFALLLLTVTTSCSSAATNLNVTVNNSTNANSNAVSQTSPTTPTDTAAAQTTTAPDALVADLYKQHDAKKSPFFQSKNRALVDKYFTKATADMIWKDATAAQGEVGTLNADPLYDAQDTDIKNFKVGQAEIKDKTATVPVTFENFGKKQKITYTLAQEGGSWKIEDIKYQEGYTLVGMFKEDASNNKKETSTMGEFEGKYQVGDTTCTVKPIKMAFEVKWEKGSGTEVFFSEGEANDKYIFASQPKTGKANVFSFDDENYNTGIFYRADGKEFPIKRIK